ncbi:hypothetical protein DCC39_02350, partial [Pueribacillus theae]
GLQAYLIISRYICLFQSAKVELLTKDNLSKQGRLFIPPFFVFLESSHFNCRWNNQFFLNIVHLMIFYSNIKKVVCKDSSFNILK